MNKNGKQKLLKQKLLGALFAEAKKVGLSAETLREYIAPEILRGKRLSEATAQEVFRVITHITGRNNPPVSPFRKGGKNTEIPPRPNPTIPPFPDSHVPPFPDSQIPPFPDSHVPPFSHSTIPPFSKGGPGGIRKRYESSRAGLLEEIADLARARYGADFIVPLNNLCARFGESDGYRKMRIAGLKELKRRLIELQREDPWNGELKIVSENTDTNTHTHTTDGCHT